MKWGSCRKEQTGQCPGGCHAHRSHLLHDGVLRVLALHDARLYEVAHGVITLAPRQDGEVGRGARMIQPLFDTAKGLGGRQEGIRAHPRSSCTPGIPVLKGGGAGRGKTSTQLSRGGGNTPGCVFTCGIDCSVQTLHVCAVWVCLLTQTCASGVCVCVQRFASQPG